MGNEKKAGNAEPKQKLNQQGGFTQEQQDTDPDAELRQQQASQQTGQLSESERRRLQVQMEVEKINSPIGEGIGRYGSRQAQG